ncbi:putative RNA/DNA demethylase ALKBH6 [Saccoglossus kowalevskii]|uniref:Alpha-ketoglutarate-dependent dioxygenase alkB homolog 6-like n=1 Tax=Saccoglossus kowalevskii TaxID=10224 RepID=A0ABM0GZH3_SACKO|nr:PREDICTED: alpha-ketoglutarate-dependent dioxygenase alkB homolog 6-like [Saccoglossus kowalevskii]
MASIQDLGATCLDRFVVSEAPPSVYYIPEFITKQEEQFLINQVYAVPKPKWTQLSHRRLQNWGGIPHPKGMVLEKLPQWLDTYSHKIASLGALNEKIPNHVLVNEYTSGQGIMPHEDGPLFYPVISTISLGGHTLLDFYHHPTTQCDENSVDEAAKVATPEDRLFGSLLLEPRSLLISKDEMYTKYLHGIADRTHDTLTGKVLNVDACPQRAIGDVLERKLRISLTIRHVPKVLKIKLNLGRR